MNLKQILEELNENEDSDRAEAIQAYIELVGEEYATADGFEDSYQGQFDSDEDFAREIAEGMGYIRNDQWPYSCIDWEQASIELMYDHMEQDGHYFSNI